MTDDRQSDSGPDSNRLTRRTLLGLFGFGAIGNIPEIQTKTENSLNSLDENFHTLPREITRYPQPVCAEVLNHRQYVPAGETIHHTAAWGTVANECQEKLEEFFEVTERSFIIDGEEVSPAEGSWHWEKISQTLTDGSDQEQWRRQWIYSTPPKEPGTYKFEVEVSYDQPFISLAAGGESRTVSGVKTYEGEYTVTLPSSLPPHYQSNGS